MFCVQCGSACPPDYKFCVHCGAARPGASPEGAALSAAAPGNYGAPQVGVAGIPPAVLYGVPQAGVPGMAHTIVYGMPPGYAQPHSAAQTNLLQNLRGRIQRLASTEELEGFSLKEMFSDVFKRRTNEEVEDYMLVGTSRTTPPIELVATGWPKPWLFFRLLIALVVSYVVLTFLFMRTGNPNCVPGMMFIGAFAVPVATLVLFFELNTPRNVSLHTVGKLFLFGAVASLGVAVLGYTLPIFDVSNMEAGIVEEIAKLLTVVVVMRSGRYKYILNGLLFGATVGAGFAAFETAGYALNKGLLPGLLNGLSQGQSGAVAMHAGVVLMLQVLRLRGILTPLGHVGWTALAAGAFWRVKKDKPTSFSMLLDVRFLKAFSIPVVLHAIWDAPWQLPFYGNDILTGLVTWYVVFGLVQQGLRQVQEEQKERLQRTLMNVEASLQPQGNMAV